MSESDAEGLDLSAREAAGLLRRARNGELSGEEIDDLWDRVPRQSKVQFLEMVFEERVVPHIDDIRERVERQRDPQEVRELYADQDPSTKEELFEDSMHELLATLAEIREHPRSGLLNLKELIRDPAVSEALLLAFDDEEHIDEEYSAAAKDFVGWYITAAGVALAPELYDEDTVREVYDSFGLEVPE